MDGVPAKVASIEYDPNRSARIALLHYANGAKAYILAPQRLEVGQVLMSGPEADIKPGNCLPLIAMPDGHHGARRRAAARSGRQARALGRRRAPSSSPRRPAMRCCACPSGELRRVPGECRATVGVLGNATHQNESGGKAGRSRWLGVRPASAAPR